MSRCLIAGLALILVVAGTAAALVEYWPSSNLPPRILLSYQGNTVSGVQGNYCWPNPCTNDSFYELPNHMPELANVVTVAQNSSVSFSVDGYSNPSSFEVAVARNSSILEIRNVTSELHVDFAEGFYYLTVLAQWGQRGAADTFEIQVVPQPGGELIGVLKNEILLYPGGARLGPFSFATWTMSTVNNGNETQRAVASLYANGFVPDFQSFTLDPHAGYSQTNCEGPARSGTSYGVSMIVSSSNGSVNFTVPVTTALAALSPFSGQVAVANSLLNTSTSFSGKEFAAAEWNMTITNSGSKPIIFFYAALYNSSSAAFPPAFSLSSCPYPEYYLGHSRAVSPQSPLTQGQSTTVSSPTFTFTRGVVPGKTYSIDYVIGYSDGTCVVFTASVQAT